MLHQPNGRAWVHPSRAAYPYNDLHDGNVQNPQMCSENSCKIQSRTGWHPNLQALDSIAHGSLPTFDRNVAGRNPHH